MQQKDSFHPTSGYKKCAAPTRIFASGSFSANHFRILVDPVALLLFRFSWRISVMRQFWLYAVLDELQRVAIRVAAEQGAAAR
jgi:hypothetical protein